MKHVSLSLEDDEVLALDRYADVEGLSRSGAIARLLAGAVGGVTLPPVTTGNLRQAYAKELLKQAQKYVGVHPVSVDGDEVVQEHDPDADEGRKQFYASKTQVTAAPVKRDPFDQSPEWDDSYAQDPPQDDVDQRAKRRGK